MSEKWFHVEAIPNRGEKLLLPVEETQHASRARRLRPGSEAVVSDGAGITAQIVLGEIEANRASATVIERTQHPPPARGLHLASALPKGDRLSTLLAMATQLGLTAFTPLLSERAVVRPAAETPARWYRIVHEACKQSRRPWWPTLHPPASPLDVVRKASADEISLVMDASGAEPVEALLAEDSPLRILVGPEAGFSSRELAQLEGAGARRMRLSSGILRIETAAAAALALFAIHS
jgi:16S rRNA (uracil1498-N3)-methyltransferase